LERGLRLPVQLVSRGGQASPDDGEIDSGVSLATAKRWVSRASRDVSVLVESDPELSHQFSERGGFHARG
jgi:hypothetical protein